MRIPVLAGKRSRETEPGLAILFSDAGWDVLMSVEPVDA